MAGLILAMLKPSQMLDQSDDCLQVHSDRGLRPALHGQPGVLRAGVLLLRRLPCMRPQHLFHHLDHHSRPALCWPLGTPPPFPFSCCLLPCHSRHLQMPAAQLCHKLQHIYWRPPCLVHEIAVWWRATPPPPPPPRGLPTKTISSQSCMHARNAAPYFTTRLLACNLTGFCPIYGLAFLYDLCLFCRCPSYIRPCIPQGLTSDSKVGAAHGRAFLKAQSDSTIGMANNT